jgi:hypothetical protein
MYFGDDRKLLDLATAVVKETVAQLPIAEQSEYNKRLRTYQYSLRQKFKLIKDRNWLYENFQEHLKESKKSKLIALIGAFVYMLANWYFEFDSENKIQMLGVFIVGYFGYLQIIESINESDYMKKMKMHEFEINRYELEISKIVIVSTSNTYNDMKDYEASSEAIKNKMLFENECYFINYCIEILQAMCVTVDVDKEARLRME